MLPLLTDFRADMKLSLTISLSLCRFNSKSLLFAESFLCLGVTWQRMLRDGTFLDKFILSPIVTVMSLGLLPLVWLPLVSS
jgi:hypothetical protein